MYKLWIYPPPHASSRNSYYTATTSGNWNAASTWGGSSPVSDDRILIPNGITVTVDRMISEEFKSIHIADGGKLQFATNVNTELRTEYLFSSRMGTLEIGTSTNKVSANVKASLVLPKEAGRQVLLNQNGMLLLQC